jgi:predicted GNAT family acetyltransferase
MNVELSGDAARFLAEAEPLLLADEPRHNLILGLAGTIRDAPHLHDDREFWLVRDDGAVVACALRTPPYNLVLAQPHSQRALDALVTAIGDELPGVVGALPEVEAFADRWTAARAARTVRVFGQGVYALDAVAPVPQAPGSSRDAGPADLPLLLEWYGSFAAEALHEDEPGTALQRRHIEHRLAADGAGIALWEVDGRPVSMSSFGGRTPNGIRIGPVYTPPELRGRGYATTLVAGLSARLLAGGRRFCFLYTDLANPTSNAVYERIGYRRVCESAQLRFERR